MGRELSCMYGLSRKEARAAESVFIAMAVRPGTELAREGRGARQLVLILEGEVTVTKRGKTLTVLSRGDAVGALTVSGITREQAASAYVSSGARIAVAGPSDIAKLLGNRELIRILEEKAKRVIIHDTAVSS